MKVLTVAIAGNPNAGKTTLFNALTGQHQRVGNYPGVTVDKKTGYTIHQDYRIEFIDLPGTYSLSAYSLEEIVARDFVLKEKPDLIIDVLDSTNLERNLYLLLQLQELGVPIIGALNMTDEARAAGIEIDEERLGKLLNLLFIKTVGSKGDGITELKDAIVSAEIVDFQTESKGVIYGSVIEMERESLSRQLRTDENFAVTYYIDWIALKLLEEDNDAIEKVRKEHKDYNRILAGAEKGRRKITKHYQEDPSIAVGEQRYAFIHGLVRQAVSKFPSLEQRYNLTDMIDTVVLNRYGGVFIFLAIMFMVYQFTFAIGNPLSDLVDSGFSWLGSTVATILPDGVINDLIVDGIIGGVGGVLVFFPLVLLLFLSLSFLEDTGYMARAAFVMDKFFQLFGLHGRSFIPYMIATGCAVPAVMAARTLPNKRDRALTIMTAPTMICGAKSPVIAMLAAAFFPKHAGTIFWLVWFASWLIALTSGMILAKLVFREASSPFVMELPPYRFPTARSVFNHMWQKGMSYIKKAGTIILAASILIWFLMSFPKQPDQAGVPHTNASTSVVETANEDQEAQSALEYSIAGRVGKFIEPVMQPAGFDWRLSIGLFAGFAAKEVIISTMGVVYGIGEADPDAESAAEERSPLKEVMGSDDAYSPAMALALMIFVMIYVPCMSVLAVVKKELGSWVWPLFQAGYTLGAAWLLAVITYRIGLFFGLG